MRRREFLRNGVGWALATATARSAWSQPQALRMGVHPYNSALALIATHRPLFQYLETALQQPVEFYTAPSFEAYVNALMAGEYDIPISPPHFAMLAMEKGHYRALVHYRTRLDPLLAVPRDSRFHGPADFAGARIAMADKSALIRIVIIKWLADAGLVADRDYSIVERPTHGASIAATVQGEADAGVATSTAFRQVPPDVQMKLRTVPSGYRFPHLFTLGHQRLGSARLEQLKQALLAFTPDHPQGKLFFEKSSYGGFEPVMPQELDELRPFIEPTRKVLDGLR